MCGSLKMNRGLSRLLIAVTVTTMLLWCGGRSAYCQSTDSRDTPAVAGWLDCFHTGRKPRRGDASTPRSADGAGQCVTPGVTPALDRPAAAMPAAPVVAGRWAWIGCRGFRAFGACPRRRFRRDGGAA